MGYYDRVMVEREYALEHSSGPWKKHKYIEKITKGAKTIYRYNITGKGYKEDADRAANAFERHSTAAYNAANAIDKKMNEQFNKDKNYSFLDIKKQQDDYKKLEKETNRYGEVADKRATQAISAAERYDTAMNSYYAKSLVGKGEALIKKLFRSI